MKSDKIHVATIGKSVGLSGELKLHLSTDFPEQFKANRVYQSEVGMLTINSFNKKRSTISFKDHLNIDLAKTLTNKNLYTTKEQSIKDVELRDEEYFWFDIIGCSIVEDGDNFGTINDIVRIGINDYLEIKGDKTYLVPYIDRYIQSVDIDKKIVFGIDIQDLIDAS